MNAPRAEMELLKDAIEKKKEDLKCPICLETAKPPIFMCPNSHIICDACAPKVQTCPQCREKLPTPLKRLFSFICPFSILQVFLSVNLPRHRFAEKIDMDLDDQQQKLVELTGRDPDPEQELQMAPGGISSSIFIEH